MVGKSYCSAGAPLTIYLGHQPEVLSQELDLLASPCHCSALPLVGESVKTALSIPNSFTETLNSELQQQPIRSANASACTTNVLAVQTFVTVSVPIYWMTSELCCCQYSARLQTHKSSKAEAKQCNINSDMLVMLCTFRLVFTSHGPEVYKAKEQLRVGTSRKGVRKQRGSLNFMPASHL